MDKVTVRFRCNPPTGFRGKIQFLFAVNDETIAEGHAGDIVSAELPSGRNEIQVLVRNESLNSMSGTTVLVFSGDASVKLRYALFGKKATLVPDKSDQICDKQ